MSDKVSITANDAHWDVDITINDPLNERVVTAQFRAHEFAEAQRMAAMFRKMARQSLQVQVRREPTDG